MKLLIQGGVDFKTMYNTIKNQIETREEIAKEISNFPELKKFIYSKMPENVKSIGSNLDLIKQELNKFIINPLKAKMLEYVAKIYNYFQSFPDLDSLPKISILVEKFYQKIKNINPQASDAFEKLKNAFNEFANAYDKLI